jgi:hypothetical protein
MPLVQLACPEASPTYGESHNPDYCLTRCEDRCLSPFLLAALVASGTRNHHKGKLVSVTSLATDGCARSLLLERTVPYKEDPLKLMYAMRGTMAHQVVEDAATYRFTSGKSLEDYGFLTEYRMLICFCFLHGGFPAPEGSDPYDPETWDSVRCPTCEKEGVSGQSDWFFLSGTCDGAEPLWDRMDEATGVLPVVLFDNKTAQEYAVDKLITGDATDSKYGAAVKDGYVEQLSTYAYLLEQIDPPEQLQRIAQQRGLPRITRLRVVDARLQFITMGKFPLTGAGYMHRKHWKHPFERFVVPEVPLMDAEWCENHIRVNGWPIYESLVQGKGRGAICPPVSNKKGAHHWKCGTPTEPGFCAFAYTEKCPNPALEYALIQDGADPEEAFQRALASLDDPDAAVPSPTKGEANPAPAPTEPKKRSTRKPKHPVLTVDVAERDTLALSAKQEALVKLLQEGMEIHEELHPKRQSVLLKDGVTQPHDVKARIIDHLVTMGWIYGTLSDKGSFVRWKFKEM